jgi:maleylpyruvate isomerase
LFQSLVEQLDESQCASASALPEWSRAQLVTHVAMNAGALSNLLTWARTGVETPMYANSQDRKVGIEAGASLRSAALRSNLEFSDDLLRASIEQMTPESWIAEVRTNSGRSIPASEVPWMRVREVWIHCIDLDVGAEFGDFPHRINCLLMNSVIHDFSQRVGFPTLKLLPTDAPTVWTIGKGEGSQVHGRVSELLAWLISRSSDAELEFLPKHPRPTVPSWL